MTLSLGRGVIVPKVAKDNCVSGKSAGKSGTWGRGTSATCAAFADDNGIEEGFHRGVGLKAPFFGRQQNRGGYSITTTNQDKSR